MRYAASEATSVSAVAEFVSRVVSRTACPPAREPGRRARANPGFLSSFELDAIRSGPARSGAGQAGSDQRAWRLLGPLMPQTHGHDGMHECVLLCVLLCAGPRASPCGRSHEQRPIRSADPRLGHDEAVFARARAADTTLIRQDLVAELRLDLGQRSGETRRPQPRVTRTGRGPVAAGSGTLKGSCAPGGRQSELSINRTVRCARLARRGRAGGTGAAAPGGGRAARRPAAAPPPGAEAPPAAVGLDRRGGPARRLVFTGTDSASALAGRAHRTSQHHSAGHGLPPRPRLPVAPRRDPPRPHTRQRAGLSTTHPGFGYVGLDGSAASPLPVQPTACRGLPDRRADPSRSTTDPASTPRRGPGVESRAPRPRRPRRQPRPAPGSSTARSRRPSRANPSRSTWSARPKLWITLAVSSRSAGAAGCAPTAGSAPPNRPGWFADSPAGTRPQASSNQPAQRHRHTTSRVPTCFPGISTLSQRLDQHRSYRSRPNVPTNCGSPA